MRYRCGGCPTAALKALANEWGSMPTSSARSGTVMRRSSRSRQYSRIRAIAAGGSRNPGSRGGLRRVAEALRNSPQISVDSIDSAKARPSGSPRRVSDQARRHSAPRNGSLKARSCNAPSCPGLVAGVRSHACESAFTHRDHEMPLDIRQMQRGGLVRRRDGREHARSQPLRVPAIVTTVGEAGFALQHQAYRVRGRRLVADFRRRKHHLLEGKAGGSRRFGATLVHGHRSCKENGWFRPLRAGSQAPFHDPPVQTVPSRSPSRQGKVERWITQVSGGPLRVPNEISKSSAARSE